MNTPHLYYVPELVKWSQTASTCHPEAGWIPLRPLGFQGLSLKRRLKLAWGVFTGKYDAVYWEPTPRDLSPPVDNSDLRELLGKAIDSVKAAPGVPFGRLPSKTNLDLDGPPMDQGDLGSSSACAVTAALAATGLDGVGAAPFMYYNEKLISEHERTS